MFSLYVCTHTNITQFLKGMRELRSDIAHKIPKNARHIFDIANVDFLDKKLRRDMPEVQALLNENAFLYAVGMTSKPKAFLRHPCIIKVRSHIFCTHN